MGIWSYLEEFPNHELLLVYCQVLRLRQWDQYLRKVYENRNVTMGGIHGLTSVLTLQELRAEPSVLLRIAIVLPMPLE